MLKMLSWEVFEKTRVENWLWVKSEFLWSKKIHSCSPPLPMRFEVSFQSLDVQLKPKTH